MHRVRDSCSHVGSVPTVGLSVLMCCVARKRGTSVVPRDAEDQWHAKRADWAVGLQECDCKEM